MFTHPGLRPLWPVIAFVPWLVFGAGYLLKAARHKHLESPWSRTRRFHVISMVALALLATSRVVSADPALEESPACAAATAQEAKSLADRLYEQGDYRHAGQCYQAAGDLAHANLAFLKAAGPAGEDTARDLKVQRDAAKALFSGVAQAFRGNH